MNKTLWTSLMTAALWSGAIILLVLPWTDVWNEAIPSLYRSMTHVAAPASLSEWPLKVVLGVGAIVALIAFHVRAILEIVLFKLPDEPAKSANLFQLIEAAKNDWVRAGFGSPEALLTKVYDRLQTGDLNCWGRRSRGHPRMPQRPWPARRFILPRFWRRNTIKDLDYWLDNQQRHRVGVPEGTVTQPARRWLRYRAVYYFDLVFDADEIRQIFGAFH